MSDPSFEMRLQRMFSDHPHYPDTPLFAVEVENRLSRGWALRRLLIGSAGVVGGLIATVQVAGARVGERMGEALRTAEGAERSIGAAAGQLPTPFGDFGQLPFGMEAVWLVLGLAVLAAALLAGRSIREL